jgi:cytochrome b pre-mRNA-processing protein 3
MSLISALKRPFARDRQEWRQSRRQARRTIEAIYGAIVTQARRPAFYAGGGVPDTVEGRFDMVLLHLWIVLRRLRGLADGANLSQLLFDHFCSDMDANLREMGVGDTTVPKRMKSFGEAFYGRTAAYDSALEVGGDALAAAVARNIFNRDAADENARRLADYAHRASSALMAVADEALAGASWKFPDPQT